MRFPKFANSIVSLVVLALAAPVVVGCAASAEEAPEAESLGSTTQAIEPATALSMVNGLVTAYTTLNNLTTYGTLSVETVVLERLNQANRDLASIKATQEQEFLQVKTDIVIGDINKIENKVDSAWLEYERAQTEGTASSFVPSGLSWTDAADMLSLLQGANGTSNGFKLIADKMRTLGGETDPLGKYAVRMRTRLAQIAFLMTRTSAMTPGESSRYATQRQQLEDSFLSATRSYFLAKVEVLEKNSGVSETCIKRFAEGYVFTVGGAAAYSSESYYDEGTLGSRGGGMEKCEVARKNWQFQTVEPSRTALVNTIYAQQKVFVQQAPKTPGTLEVTQATYQGGRDVQKAVAMMCNSRETCSFPGGTFANRLGSNASQPAGTLGVSYRCAGESSDRQASFAPGRDAVLSCNIQNAIAGEYYSPAHDATAAGPTASDTVLIKGTPKPHDTWNTGTFWTWTTQGSSSPLFGIDGNDDRGWNVLNNRQNNSGMAVEWGDEGRPLRILGPCNGKLEWFNWSAPLSR